MRIKVLAFLRLQKQRFYDQTEYKRSANKQSTSAYASPQIYPRVADAKYIKHEIKSKVCNSFIYEVVNIKFSVVNY